MRCCEPLLHFLLRNWKRILVLIAVALFFSWLGAHTPRTSEPGMCHIYG